MVKARLSEILYVALTFNQMILFNPKVPCQMQLSPTFLCKIAGSSQQTNKPSVRYLISTKWQHLKEKCGW